MSNLTHPTRATIPKNKRKTSLPSPTPSPVQSKTSSLTNRKHKTRSEDEKLNEEENESENKSKNPLDQMDDISKESIDEEFKYDQLGFIVFFLGIHVVAFFFLYKFGYLNFIFGEGDTSL